MSSIASSLCLTNETLFGLLPSYIAWFLPDSFRRKQFDLSVSHFLQQRFQTWNIGVLLDNYVFIVDVSIIIVRTNSLLFSYHLLTHYNKPETEWVRPFTVQLQKHKPILSSSGLSSLKTSRHWNWMFYLPHPNSKSFQSRNEGRKRQASLRPSIHPRWVSVWAPAFVLLIKT